MVVLSVAAILTTIGVPSLSTIRDSGVSTRTNELITDLALARTGRSAAARPSPSARAPTARAAPAAAARTGLDQLPGQRRFRRARQRLLDAGRLRAAQGRRSPTATLRANNVTLAAHKNFDGIGMATASFGQLRLCDERGISHGRIIGSGCRRPGGGKQPSGSDSCE